MRDSKFATWLTTGPRMEVCQVIGMFLLGSLLGMCYLGHLASHAIWPSRFRDQRVKYER